MNNIFNIFLTSSLTVTGGVIIYVIGQIISKFYIEPIHEFRLVLGEIANARNYYANVYSSPGLLPKEILDETSSKIRSLSTLLRSKLYLIPNYSFFSKIRILPESAVVEEASSELIGLSNAIYQNPKFDSRIYDRIWDRADKIKLLLKLP